MDNLVSTVMRRILHNGHGRTIVQDLIVRKKRVSSIGLGGNVVAVREYE